MADFKFSEPNDPSHFYPSRSGAQFVCDTCCEDGTLRMANGYIVWECSHMTVYMADGKIANAITKGPRH